jgi:hypothetical protein
MEPLHQPVIFFCKFDDEKHPKKWCMHDQMLLLAAILAQWWHPVVSSEALDLLYWAMCVVFYWCTAMAIEMASNVGAFFHCFCVSCRPGGCRGSTE